MSDKKVKFAEHTVEQEFESNISLSVDDVISRANLVAPVYPDNEKEAIETLPEMGVLEFNHNTLETIMDNDTLEFMTDMIYEYNRYYKAKFNKATEYNLLNGLDVNDVLSTNHSLEMFYHSMAEFNKLEKNNSDAINVYDVGSKIDEDEYDELYGLMKEGKLYKFSPSLMAILIELVNCKRENDPEMIFNIVTLK